MDEKCELTLRSRAILDEIKRVKVKIEEAIKILKKSHGLSLCQVWIPRFVKNDNEEWAVRLTGHCADDALKPYYDACDKIQNGSGGLALKALETYQACFSRNIIKGELQALIPATSASESSCCISICLRNSCTADTDYAFEFIFKSYDNNNNNNNPCVFLESLFSKLENCLSNFEFSSGAQIGRELRVLDGDDLTAGFSIFPMKNQEEEDCDGRILQRLKNMKFGNSLDRALVEIKEALLFLTESHGLKLAQVWTFLNNHKCAVKLTGYYAGAFKHYYKYCVQIQDGAGGLAAKTLVTYQPYLSKNIKINKGMLNGFLPAIYSQKKSIGCFAVCLRNENTGHFDYAFEFCFLLHHDEDPCVFLKSFLVALDKCLPNFKLPSGARLGPQLQVLDGDNLAANFEFLALIKQEEDDSMEGTNLYTNGKGRKIRGMDVSASVKFADLKTKISQRFNLVSNAYWLTYLLNGSNGRLWMKLDGDQDLSTCISHCTKERITQLLIRVLPCTISN